MRSSLSLATIASFCFLSTSAQAESSFSSAFTLNPRLEAAVADGDPFAQRTFLKGQGLIKYGSFGFNFEGFVEKDFAQLSEEPFGAPDLRKSRSTAALQEAYVDYQYNSIFLRAGRQPVRWSQSWTVPSLDLFTGRRWNRLFLDPVPEQLTHSDGVLLSYAASDIEAEVYQVIQTAENLFPKPIPNIDRELQAQTGFRVKARLHGLDVQLVTRVAPDDTLVGASMSYAFNCCVIKAEAGQSADERGFVIAGFDVFESLWGGEITFGPQVTWYQDPVLTELDIETIGYLPLRYAYGRNALELQYYGHFEKRDSFWSALVSRELGELGSGPWKTAFKISAYAQSYKGDPNRLFGIYEQLTGGYVYGTRMDLTASF